MNPVLRDKLKVIANDSYTLSALREVLEETVDKHRPTLDGSSDAVLGQKYRAYMTARELISHFFVELGGYENPGGKKGLTPSAR